MFFIKFFASFLLFLSFPFSVFFYSFFFIVSLFLFHYLTCIVRFLHCFPSSLTFPFIYLCCFMLNIVFFLFSSSFHHYLCPRFSLSQSLLFSWSFLLFSSTVNSPLLLSQLHLSVMLTHHRHYQHCISVVFLLLSMVISSIFFSAISPFLRFFLMSCPSIHLPFLFFFTVIIIFFIFPLSCTLYSPSPPPFISFICFPLSFTLFP